MERTKFRAKLITDWDRQIKKNLKNRPDDAGTILNTFRTFATDYARKQSPERRRDVISARDDVLSIWEEDLTIRASQSKARRNR